MSSTYGKNLKLSIFGQSHGAAIGMTLDGIPAGLPVDFDKLQEFLNRRAPGQNDWSTPRKEEDKPEFLSGVVDGFTCGAPIAAVIHNKNTRSGDYANLKDCPRPGHADYTGHVRYFGHEDWRGGGSFSGRLTAVLVAAGAILRPAAGRVCVQPRDDARRGNRRGEHGPASSGRARACARPLHGRGDKRADVDPIESIARHGKGILRDYLCGWLSVRYLRFGV